MQGREREIGTLSVRRPQPHTENSCSLLLQLSTITSGDRFDRKCVNIGNTEPPIPTDQSLYIIPLMVDPVKGCTEINLYNPSLLPTHQCILQCMRHTKVHHWYPDLSDKQTGCGSTPLLSINCPRRTDTRRSNTLDNTDVMDVGR